MDAQKTKKLTASSRCGPWSIIAPVHRILIANKPLAGSKLRRLGNSVLLALTMFMSSAFTQDFNAGSGATIINTGTIRVKQNSSNVPPVDGMFEYFGDNQIISATQYRNLLLTGTGTKTTTGGNFSVSQDITIAPAVTLSIQTGASITLIGNLIENGYLSGSIRKIEDLSGATTSSNFGEIGSTIAWTAVAPGTTTVNRVSGTASAGNGNQSILRYYDIAPTFNTNLNVDFIFRYSDNELNGQDANTLELWRSIDGGVTWRRQGGTVNTVTRSITMTGIRSLSRWTASDAANPLGPLDYEWVAKNIVQGSGDGQSGIPGATLPAPFIVTVTDAYANPVAGVPVIFTIASSPGGAGLSVTNAVTDASGQATTTLTLGSTGNYVVTANSPGLVGSPVNFTATATSAPPTPVVATTVVRITGDAQVQPIMAVLQPFAVRVLGSGGVPVPNIPVQFAIVSTPLNSNGQTLSVMDVVTDSNGDASTILTLGNKVGDYIVTATPSPATLTGSPVTFTARAINGAASSITIATGDAQYGSVRLQLPEPLSVSVRDLGGNSVPNHSVQFTISQTPAGATGQALSAEVVNTDSNGIASTMLTLGSQQGVYRVSAVAVGLDSNSVVFTANAFADSSNAAMIQLTSGNGQTAPILTTLPDSLVVTVLDSVGNPVEGESINFGIESAPIGSAGLVISSTSVTTNSLGRAAVSVTLGDKVGEYVLSASRPGLQNSPVHFTVSAVHGAAVSISEVFGNGQSAVIGTSLLDPLAVVVRDIGGNVVPGASVMFAIQSVPTGATGQLLSVEKALTDINGVASTRVTLGSKVGRYSVVATSDGLVGSPIQFNLTALHDSAASIILVTGNNQAKITGSTLDTAFVVRVLDKGNNVVPGVSVQFAITQAPQGAVGQTLSATNVLTNASGEASVFLTLGDQLGEYKVTASVSGAGSVVFTAHTNVVVGDPNADFEINIADLTQVIDHVNQKVILTGADSVQADVNKDLTINIQDIVLIQQYLLGIIPSFSGTNANAKLTEHLPLFSIQENAAAVRGEFEVTDFGVRFSLQNDVPVKGIQLVMKFRTQPPIGIDSSVVTFSRASMMSVPLNISGNELRLIASNSSNIPIEAGTGTIFRFPTQLQNLNDVESIDLIISTGEVVHKAVRGPVEIKEQPTVPLSFKLEQNFPNPFNPSTTIEFEVPDSQGGSLPVVIEVYNQIGERVKVLTNRDYEAGRHRVVWMGVDEGGSRVASGTYFYRLISGSFQSAKRMILLK